MTNDQMTPRDAYLETQISTATPQRLRLMLIDAAIRIARQTGDLWHASRNEEALESLIRCRAIISELIAGVKPEGSELGRKVVSVYLFLFTTLTEAQLTRDVTKLESAIRVLVEERQTWAQVCEQLADAPPTIPPTPDREEQLPQQVSGGLMHASASPGFSLDA